MLANRDVWAGLIFIVFGVAAAVIARGYPLGSAARMGPGYFPTALGILLIVLGAAIVVRGLRTREHLWPSWNFRSAGWILVSVLVFAAAIRPLGLVIAAAATLAVACLATRRYPVREAGAVVVALVLVAALLFVEALGLPLRLWPA